VGGYRYEHFTIADNATITPERFAEITDQYVPGTVWYRRDIEGERTLAEGLIYPMYQEAIGEPQEGIAEKYCLSMDYGTRNAFAALLWEKHGDVWYATREYYYSGRDEGRSKTDSEYGDEIDRWISDIPGRLDVVIDPSAASFIALLRRKSGRYRVRPADNSVADGIRETATAMQTGRIKISATLKNWKDEAAGYIWDDDADEDRPVKEDDHLMDATRYFVKTMRVIVPKKAYVSPFGG
jgi:PBSX family phage terminase large subunit